MDQPLHEQRCRPIARATAALAGAELERLRAGLHADWRIASGPLLARRFASQDYPGLAALAARIASLAQEQDHHPDLELAWGRLDVAISTHSIGGLSHNDFILTAKIDRLEDGAGQAGVRTSGTGHEPST